MSNSNVTTTSSSFAFRPQDLLRAEAFPHAVDRLAIQETHISWIILTGSFAYKIKKPVKFDFIDASTLDRRRRFCEEELRLNRRLAAELYIDVLPIVVRAGKPALGGTGPVIEYAVRMRQFSERDELLSLLRSDSVTPQEIAALGALIADFHIREHVLGPESLEQSEGLAAELVLDNIAELSSHLRGARRGERIDDLVEWTQANARKLTSLLRMRKQSGSVRDCHGDLHAGNIVRFEGHLVPFDCIEFNPALRNIDVIDDVAFLFMDLISHRREDLAFVLINAYLERTGDYAGIALLRFYSVYRALVRAKVDVLALEQGTKDVDRTTRLQDRLATARQLAKTDGKPMLILMHGVSGSGKSWLSERLAARIPAVRIRSDVERKRLAQSRPEPPESRELYSADHNRLTYRHVLSCAQECLAAGFDCIADATFLKHADRESFHELAARMGVPHVILSCNAPYPVLAKRIAQRNATHRDASDADLAVLRQQLDALQQIEIDERQFLVSVDTSDPRVVDSAFDEIKVRMR